MRKAAEKERKQPKLEINTEELINQDLDDILNDSLNQEEWSPPKAQRDFRKSEPTEDPTPSYYERCLRELEEKHKAQMLNLETLSMMAKYQIMYIKLETKLRNLGCLFLKKPFDHKLAFFTKLRANRVTQAGNVKSSKTNYIGAFKLLHNTLSLTLTSKNKAWAFHKVKTFASLQEAVDPEREKLARLSEAFKRASAAHNIGLRKLAAKKSPSIERAKEDLHGTRESENRDGSIYSKGTAARKPKQQALELVYRKRKLDNKELRSKLRDLQSLTLVFLEEISQRVDKSMAEQG
jgi:hypothetical protein